MGARPPAHCCCLSLLMDPLLAQLELALAIGRKRRSAVSCGEACMGSGA
jgi:hypothetical protein